MAPRKDRGAAEDAPRQQGLRATARLRARVGGRLGAKRPRDVSSPPEPYESSQIPGFPLFAAGPLERFHLNTERKDDSRRLGDLGVTRTDPLVIPSPLWSGFRPPSPTVPASHNPRYPTRIPQSSENVHSPVRIQSKVYLGSEKPFLDPSLRPTPTGAAHSFLLPR